MEIKSMARKVSEMKVSFSTEISRCHGQVDNSSTWWQGDAGKSFRSGYVGLRTETKSLINKMDKLYSLTQSLSDKVQQADDVRKAEAAAAARAAAEQQRLSNSIK
ncbi:WXG100 family type VII secretion target [Paenibacillus segetis]|nr:WXG100 family type VII secretion target [Paenibacillus segetis]